MGSDGGTGDIGSCSINDNDSSSCSDNGAVDELSDPSDRGLIPRICSSLFSRMATEGKKTEGTTYRTEVSFQAMKLGIESSITESAPQQGLLIIDGHFFQCF